MKEETNQISFDLSSQNWISIDRLEKVTKNLKISNKESYFEWSGY